MKMKQQPTNNDHVEDDNEDKEEAEEHEEG